jgi:hypothetical protein
MRGVYKASIKASGLTAAKTLLYITAPSGKCVEILSASVTNASNATNAQLEAVISKISSLGTPTATTITPTKLEQGDQAAGSTVKGNVTASEPTYATAPAIEVNRRGFASLAGWEYAPVPEDRLVIAPTDSWGIYLVTSSLSSTDLDIELTFREIG